ncbi:DNA-3-methyladenine glycosylase I [Pseudooceanicola algae]|uniref:DNA-3-methyladenine glycosylase I n=1 Tax=Pseudooceanicola algae TaxID=1537215 RepID=A0A418SKK5_9RHOB|nr:DNA-3-methyladenine glycosylase I [Pseudooceanicola algae]QPM90690.1 DNA-3-methyladenine glycosylase 1 [Pseudooceanicola algae]
MHSTDLPRCSWVSADPLYLAYHDTEWGVPERDSQALWEKLILDGFQAGLSWLTILKKRGNFRRAFCDFNPAVIATWGEDEVATLLTDAGIIRHRGKIEAVIGNARAYLEIEANGGFDQFLWNYVDGEALQPRYATHVEVPTQTALSLQVSKDLKKAGFRFVGPTIVYAFMEATGLVNDHLTSCHCHDRVAALKTA